MAEPARDALFSETKRLLAALNDENKQLKEENMRLLSQCKTAEKNAMHLMSEKEGLEKDLKQINFSLMQQLRVKLKLLKEQEEQTVLLREKVTVLESQLQASSVAQDSSAKECAIRREQIQNLENKVQQLTERLYRTEAEAGQYADHLNAAIAGHRENISNLQLEGMQRLNHVEEALRVSQNNEASLVRTVEELRYELGRAKDVLRQKHSHNSEGNRRAISARSEALYAREQVLATCSASYQQLRELQMQARAMERLVLEANNQTERVWSERHAQLEDVVQKYMVADEALITFLCHRIADGEEKVRAIHKELSLAQQRLSEEETKLEKLCAECTEQRNVLETHQTMLDRRQSEAQSLAEALTSSQEEIQTLRTELQTRGRIEEELRSEVVHWQREAQSCERQVAECRLLLLSEREHSEAARRSCERDADVIEEQLQEFGAAVTRALRKLDSAFRRRYRRPSSSVEGVTSSWQSTELAHGSSTSPLVQHLGSSPLVSENS